MESEVPKVQELRTRFPSKNIQVDGGVGPGTIGCCARAGQLYFRAPPALSTKVHLRRLERDRRRNRSLWRVGSCGGDDDDEGCSRRLASKLNCKGKGLSEWWIRRARCGLQL